MPEYKAGAVIYESYLHTDRRPVGAVLEVPTGHTVQWRFRPEVERIEATRRYRGLAALRARIASTVFWSDRVPSLHRLGLDGVEDDPHVPPLDLITPREWLVRETRGSYARLNLHFVRSEALFDAFYNAVIGPQTTAALGPPEDPFVLIPNYEGVFLRPDGFRIGRSSGVEWLGETLDMLMDGIVGYRYEAPGSIQPIRSAQRLGELAGSERDRAERRRALRRPGLSPRVWGNRRRST